MAALPNEGIICIHHSILSVTGSTINYQAVQVSLVIMQPSFK
jgi:hypothetical protein